MGNTDTLSFNINARVKKYGYMCIIHSFAFFIILIIVIQGLFSDKLFNEIALNWLMIILFSIATIAAVCGVYLGLMPKILQIDKVGVKELHNKKIYHNLSWKDVDKIEYHKTKENNFVLRIIGKKSEIEVFNWDFKNGKNEIETVFHEILKYRSKYNFIIDKNT